MIIAFSCLLLLMMHVTSYAGTQKLENLNYEAKLNQDGSMDVIETWDVDVEETNTLFKTFTLDSSKYKGIENVEVSEIRKDGSKKNFQQIEQEMYHVTKDCYYGLQTKSNTFEIAWGVGLDDSSARKKYQIQYKIVDVVKVYQDCSELYWMFLSKENEIPVRTLTGTISLPSEVKNKDNLRAWAHGPLDGEVQIPNNNQVTFQVRNLSSNEMVEVRLAVLENLFTQSSNQKSENKFASIVEEETKWAEEANKKRERAKMLWMGIGIIIILTMITMLIVLLKKILTYRKLLKETPDQEKVEKIPYFRDIPEKEATPVDAAFLYYFKETEQMNQHLAKVLSATLLNLCMKKRLTFEIVEEKKKEMIQMTLQEGTGEALAEDETVIYELIKKVAKEKGSFTTKDLENYAKKHNSSFLTTLGKLPTIAKKKQVEKENYDKKLEKERTKWMNKMAGYIVGASFVGILTIFMLYLSFPVIIEFILCAVLCNKMAKKYIPLTKKGREEKEEWEALNRYMKDFSMMDEKTVPELVLWEKYLVFATVFGSADKVMEQLKVKYPELQDQDYMMSHGYYYLYLMNTSHFQTGFVGGLNSAVNKAYSASVAASSASSGGGYGGGFSSGGGRRRRRRPEWAVDK